MSLNKSKHFFGLCIVAALMAVAGAQVPPVGAVREASQTINDGIQTAVNGTTNAINTVAGGTEAGKSINAGLQNAANATQDAVKTIANGTQQIADAVNGTLARLTGKNGASSRSFGTVSVAAAVSGGLLLVLLM